MHSSSYVYIYTKILKMRRENISEYFSSHSHIFHMWVGLPFSNLAITYLHELTIIEFNDSRKHVKIIILQTGQQPNIT